MLQNGKKQNITTQLIEAPFWQQILFCGLLGIITMAIFQNFILFDLRTKRNNLAKKLQHQTQNIGSLQSFAKTLGSAKKTYESLQKEEPELLKVADYPEFLVQLSSFSALNFTIKKLEPQQTKTEAGILYKELSIQVEAPLVSIVKFTQAIPKIGKTSSIQKLSCKKIPKSTLYQANFFLLTGLSKG